MTTKDLDFIVYLETGGRAAYTPAPEGNPGISGVTIGIGYDLGQVTGLQFAEAWRPVLTDQTFARLRAVLGLQGDAARAAVPALKDVRIPFDMALDVFGRSTLPYHAGRTFGIYPQAQDLPSNQRAALVSLVFNRGSSLVGDRRLEMRQIQDALKAGDLSQVPTLLRAMKRLWPTVEGLRNRREAEAVYWETGTCGAV